MVDEVRLYSNKTIFAYCLILAFAILAAKVTEGLALVAVVPMLFFWGAIRPANLFFSVAASMSLVLCNPYFAPKSIAFIVVYRMLLMACGGVAFIKMIQSKVLSTRMYSVLLFYVLYMVLPSAAGWNPTISFLKLILFTLTFACLILVSSQIVECGTRGALNGRSALLCVCAFFVLGSMCLIPFPSISLLNKYDLPVEVLIANGLTLFKGMSMHSQALGPMVAVVMVFLYSDLIFNLRRVDWLYLILLVCCPVLIVKTGSRTAMGAALGGCIIATYYFIRIRAMPQAWRARVLQFVTLGVVSAIVLAFCSSAIRDSVAKLALKFDSGAKAADVSLEGVTSTRKAKFEDSIRNFKDSPLIGNGFQVSSEYAGVRVPITEVVSAPVEKGVIVSAVLEEGGSFGMLIFTVFVLYVWRASVRRRAFVTFSTFATMLLSNMGEFTFFSLTATGGFQWLLVLASSVLEEAHLRKMALQPYFGMPMRM